MININQEKGLHQVNLIINDCYFDSYVKCSWGFCCIAKGNDKDVKTINSFKSQTQSLYAK